MSTPEVKIIVADDHILLRDALAALVDGFTGCKVACVAANGYDVLNYFKTGQTADIIILDLNMPEMDGYETARWLSTHHPSVKILILTMYDSEIALIRLLQEGGRGFLKKDIHPHDLRKALAAVMDDGYYYTGITSNRLATLFKKDNSKKGKLGKSMLSDQEIIFLRLASSDKTYKEIAADMSLSTRVIDNYRECLFDKLDVRSRVGLAIYAIRNGIVTF